jgi:hypothetical protein
MGLPIRIGYIDAESTIRDATIRTSDKRSPAPPPEPDYFPTYRAVRCLECKTVGVAEFVNGFNLRDGDRLMDGKPIVGLCLRCRKETELIPIPMDAALEKEVKLLYDVQRALQEAAKRGERPVGPDGIVWPLARIEAYEQHRREQGILAP